MKPLMNESTDGSEQLLQMNGFKYCIASIVCLKQLVVAFIHGLHATSVPKKCMCFFETQNNDTITLVIRSLVVYSFFG